jgi:pseudouridine synthase, RluA family
MINTFEYKITKENNGQTIGQFLKEKKYSRQIIIHLKKTPNGILVNRIWAYIYTILKEDDILTITLEENTSSANIIPIEMSLDIIYEDEHLMIINKPANTPIHPSMGNFENTIANGLAQYFSAQNKNFIFRCINRLDRDTTGLFIVAKNMLSSCILSDMVKKRQIHREYIAIVKGVPPLSGTIHVPISRVSDSVIERYANLNGTEDALTHYKLISTDKNHSLVSLTLETGRTHQIRVHMKYIGFPLIGDFLYNPDFEKINRQALHSYCLKFKHPITELPMIFYLKVPPDMDFIS